MPTDWSDTQVLNGEVGDYVTIARKERNGHDWYLGSVTDENQRMLDLQLNFLDAGSHLPGTDLSRRRRCGLEDPTPGIAIEKRPVRRGDTLRLRLAPGGGAAIRFQAQR